jgi:ADP-ribose pyrophosphatase YjhB (NUDIX family)
MKYITEEQFKSIKNIPRGRLTARYLVYTGILIIDGNRILLCKPKNSKYPGWQLPGGKVLWSEKFTECILREILEETGMEVKLGGIIGIYQRETTPEDEEFLRIIYSAKTFKVIHNKPIDPEIEKIQWFDIQEILEEKIEIQSKQIIKEIQDYQNKKEYPLDIIQIYKW